MHLGTYVALVAFADSLAWKTSYYILKLISIPPMYQRMCYHGSNVLKRAQLECEEYHRIPWYTSVQI